MKALLRSAAYRIAFASTLAFVLAVLAIGAMSYLAVEAAFARQLDQTIEEGRNALMPEGDEGLPSLAEMIAQREREPGNALVYAVFDPAGRRVAGSLDTSMPAPGWARISFRDPGEGPDPARAETVMLSGGYRLTVAADLEPVEAINARLLEVFALGFVAALAIGTGIALASGRYLSRRLTNVERVADAFAGGDRLVRAHVGARGDEFDRLAASLNGMLDRIAALVANLRQVTGDLAHDMRTPLFRLRGQLEELHRVRGAERETRIEEALERTDDILAMFGAMLRIAELEEGELQRWFQPIDVGALVSDLVETHIPLAEDNGDHLEEATCEPCQVLGERELLAQALINLIENAVRHTPTGSHIVVGALQQGDACRLFVADDGPGISEAELERVTKRFVRLDTARSSPGHGLGLSLAKAVAEAHGGRLELVNSSPGLEAALLLPRIAP